MPGFYNGDNMEEESFDLVKIDQIFKQCCAEYTSKSKDLDESLETLDETNQSPISDTTEVCLQGEKRRVHKKLSIKF